jgi:hypothetical protein
VKIFVEQAIDEDAFSGPAGCFLRRLDAAHNDIGSAKSKDLILSLLTGSPTNRQHSDHGEHSEYNSKHGQPGPELVKQQTFESELNCSDEILHGWSQLKTEK